MQGVFPRRPGVLLYDHRNFGRNESKLRQEINPWIQCRGYRDAMKFAERLDRSDPERIALWGDSYTSGQVIVVGAIEPRVKVIVAQIPVFGAESPKVDLGRRIAGWGSAGNSLSPSFGCLGIGYGRQAAVGAAISVLFSVIGGSVDPPGSDHGSRADRGLQPTFGLANR